MRQLTANQALDFTRAVEKMLADPDLTGDQLLLGIALRHHFAAGKDDATFKDVMSLTGWDRHRLIRTLRDDAPRYTPDRSQAGKCANPMIRRDGLCGKPTAWKILAFRDPDTGEVTERGACSRHWPDLEAQHRANRADWLAAGSPKPGPNTGGALPRYFDAEWAKVYKDCGAWGIGDTVPEVPATFPKLMALATDNPQVSAPVRPALQVVRD